MERHCNEASVIDGGGVAAGISCLHGTKMSGHGNDFIIVECFAGYYGDEWSTRARCVCDRDRSMGADGLLVLEHSFRADFRLRIFNADGSEADMCGNGARCAAVYAARRGRAPNSMAMETAAGIVTAVVDGDHASVKLAAVREVLPPVLLALDGAGAARVHLVDSGVPHAVVFAGTADGAIPFEFPLQEVPPAVIHQLGQDIRHHPRWGDQGANADFVEIVDGRRIAARTFERGVEGETRACGTGAVASVYAALRAGFLGKGSVAVEMPGGVLSVFLKETGDGVFDAWLAGTVDWIGEGVLPGVEECS